MVEHKPLTSLRVSFITAFFTAVFFVFLFLYLGFNLRDYTYEDSKEIAKEISRKAAIETEQYFYKALNSAISMGKRALLIKELGGDRFQVREMLKAELLSSPNFLGTWTLWEPNAFDNRDYIYKTDSSYNTIGSLGIAYFRFGDKVFTEIMGSQDYQGAYYQSIRENKSVQIIEPYKWTYSGHKQSFFGTSISVPLIIDSAFVGAIGIDIDLNNLSEKLNEVKFYNSGYLTLIASNGIIVSHPDTSFVAKNFFKLIHSPDSTKYISAFNGEELVLETLSEFSDKQVFRFFYPFNVGSGKPWNMMVEIPIAEATQRSNQLLVVSSVILFVGLGLILFLTFNIFDRRRYERTIIVAMNEIEKRSELAAQNEQNYREIFNSTNEAIFIHNEQTGEVLDVNDVMLQMYGYSTREEVINLSISSFSSNEGMSTQKNAKQLVEKAINEGPQVFEWQAMRKDGDLFWVEVSLRKTTIGGEGRVLAVVRDITERKQVEEALKQSQQLFETLAKSAPVGIFRTRADGYTIYVNPRWSDLSGLSFDEALGDGWLNAVHPDDRGKLKNEWSSKVDKNERSSVEYRFQRKDGKLVWVLGNAVPEVAEGKVIGYIGTITNITEIKQAQENLLASEKKFRELAELLPQTIWEADVNGVVTFANKNGLTTLGYTEKDISEGVSILNAIVPEDRERAMSNIKKRIAGNPSVGEDYFAQRKDGTRFPVQIFTSTVFKNGVPVGIRGISIDMTDIKKAESLIRESQERYKTMIDAFTDVILISDLGGRIVFGNKEFERLTGVTPRFYANPRAKTKIHPEDFPKVKTVVGELFNSMRVHSDIIEVRIIDSNDSVHWISGTISKLKLKNLSYLQIIARDVTEKKKLDQELERYKNHLEFLVKQRTEELEAANEELTAINEEISDQKGRLQDALTSLKDAQNQLIHAEKMASLGVLASGIAHEINNPLNFIHGGILGLEKIIQKSMPYELETVDPLINAIKEGVRRSTEIVRSLNHYTRKDNQPKRECDIHSIIDNCLLIVHSQLSNRIEVVKDYSNEVKLVVCNEGKLHQAFLNIIINSIQAINTEGTISIKTVMTKGRVRVLFNDNGVGISSDIIDKITDPFFTTKDQGEGIGLGLSITSTIIEDHGGKLTFKSDEGRGTTVVVELPLNNSINE